MDKLLIVDDESSICTALSFALEDDYEIYTALDEVSAIDIITNTDISIVLLDLNLGKSNGISVLKQIKIIKPDIVVLIMTAYGTIESTVEAIKSGAFYYITKPIKIDELLLLINKANEHILLNSKIKYLSNQININNSVYNMVGNSKKMADIFDLIDRVKDIESNVLITGESGTGKELVARAIHFEGIRNGNPFNVINCSAIPGNLLESELFGFKKGSFTGAFKDRKGVIESSNEGTLFLDEIGDMDMNLQTKLLRVLQDKEVYPIGSVKGTKVNVRFIAATNKDLKQEVKTNRFRKDLFYRLNVIPIKIPPLRERREDIPKLVDHFIKKYNILLNKNINGISAKALEAIEKYKFDGNIRELQNIIERAIALTKNNFINVEDLPEDVFLSENIVSICDDVIPIYVGENMESIERKVIEYNLKKFKNNRKKTSEALGISERNLRYKIKDYN